MNRKLLLGLMFSVVAIKLPYEAGQRFVVVQGYDSPPTHVAKDLYAIDFSQDGCDAYGKLAVAAAGGTVLLAQQAGYNGGYGTQVLIVDASRIVARYAHMIPESLTVATGDAVAQGEPLGEIGNTGLVEGAACPTHPGTHIHFAMYGENADGSFSPFRPEPISGYVGITADRWYLSDNALAIATVPGAEVALQRAAMTLLGMEGGAGVGAILGASSSSQSQQVALTSSTPSSSPQSLPSPASSPTAGAAPSGGVSASPPAPVSQTEETSENNVANSSAAQDDGSSSTTIAPPSPSSSPPPPTITITDASFNSSTLAIDLAWQAPTGTAAAANASSTNASSSNIVYAIFASSAASTSTLIPTTTATNFSYPLAPTDFGASLQFTIGIASDSPLFALTLASTTDASIADLSTIATVVPAISLPDWWTVLQPRDDTDSNGSWYDDNWFDLGAGFYGTIRSLTLEGAIDNSSYGASHVYLDEYLDAGYTRLNQSWTLSDNAPFTNGMRAITLGGLDIPLQPNKYYRLRTYQDYQNRSVILAGTSATGTAMWDEFIGGIGRVEHPYPFYPYLAAAMIPNYPPLAPPNPIATATIAFDAPNSVLNISWPATTDPDTTSSLLTYEINVTGAWQSVGNHLATTTPVVYGNSYLIGLRAVDDFGATSTPLVIPWNFPAGYFPVPEQLEADGQLPDGAQSITFAGSITISSMGFWINSDPGSQWGRATSFVDVRADAGGAPGAEVASSSWVTIGHADWTGERTYPFSPAITLPAGTYWFSVDAAPVGNNAPTFVFGSSGDTYPGGEWSTAPGQDVFFRITE